MEDFYNAMTTYINSKKPKCQHERTFYWQGWRACVECGLCIHKVFSQDPYSHVAGYNFIPKEDRFPKIRKTMIEMIGMIVIKDGIDVRNLRMDLKTGEIYDAGHPGGDLPRELFDHLKELSMTCLNLEKNTKCHRRSLCATVLWEKVKSLYPTSMTLTEFSKKVGVSMPTIIKTRKKLK